jgi:diguanylate cyclase (GGDEF)-like protein
MKHSLRRLSAWWFATMVPTYVPPTTIEQREAIRKRRLFSIIMVIPLPTIILSSLVEIFVPIKGVQIGPGIESGVSLLLALWINQRGYLKSASIFFLLTSFVSMAVIIDNISLSIPLFSFCLWTLLPMSLVLSSLFLPIWGPLLLGGIDMLYMCWFVFIDRYQQIATYLNSPAEQIFFLLATCIIISMIAIFSAISVAATRRAVIQADRAMELEQAHEALSALHVDLTGTHASLEAAHATIQMQALTDVLTNLPNHRAVMEQFAKDIERARRHKLAFSILFFDADRFKHVNDTYGHGAGDAVLREIGERAATCLRTGDTLARFGGEEFVILLFEADASGATIVAERILASVSARPMALAEVEGGITMTVSIGQATYIEDGCSEQDMLAQADQAMYVAKRMGRNQVRSAAEARQLSTDSTRTAAWNEQTRIEAMQREGVSVA